MSLPIRYSPMSFYFWLSVIFHTPQVLRHLPRQCDLLRPSHDCHWLYPIPIVPLVWYHIRDLSYDLQTTSLHFPFLVFSPYLTHSFAVRPITDRCAAQSGPYHMFRRTRTLCSFYLSFVFKTFVSTPKKFPPELRLKFVSSHRFASLCLHTFIPLLYFILPTPFALSHCSEPPSRTFLHPSILHLETIFTAPESHPSAPHRIYT